MSIDQIRDTARVANMRSIYLHDINPTYSLLPNTKNEPFKVVLCAGPNIVMSILLPDFSPFTELVAHMPQEEIQVFLTLAFVSVGKLQRKVRIVR